MIKFKYEDYIFSISINTFQKIVKYKQVDRLLEAGGMLIGSIIANSNEIDINDCTEPIIEDKRFRLGFERSDKHNMILKEKWENSNFTKLYLGEWHTHPQSIPSPSSIDKNSWKKLLSDSNTESNFLVFLIIGFTSMEIWIGDRKKDKLVRGGNYRY